MKLAPGNESVLKFSVYIMVSFIFSATYAERLTEAFIDVNGVRKSITRFDSGDGPQPVQAVFLVPGGYEIQSASESGTALLAKNTGTMNRFWRWQYAQVDFLTAVSYDENVDTLQGGYGRCSANGDSVIYRYKQNIDWIRADSNF